MRSEAVDYYHELLSGHYLESTRDLLESQNQKLSVAGRPVCTVLRPFFLDHASYVSIRNASELIMKGVRTVVDRVLNDSSFRKEMHLSAEEEELISIDTGYGPADMSSRLDGFLAANGSFHFVEYNADSPGGLGYGQALSDLFSSMPIWEKFSSRFPARAFPVKSYVFKCLLSAYQKWGGRSLPNIAVVDWENVPTKNEFQLLVQEFEKHGCQVRIGDPKELEYSGGKLYLSGFPVDLIYKRLVVSELLREFGLNHPLVQAVRDHAVCCVNGFAVQMSFKKTLFALLSDTIHAGMFEAEVVKAIQRHIPWTRILREGNTIHGNANVDLVPFVLSRREQMVLKPDSEYGGRGVMLGWECTDSEWEIAVQTALKSSYVVQHRVEVGSEIYPSIIENNLHFDQRYFDLDPYVWNGSDVEGCGVRLSRLALLNVSAGGGSATPLFVLQD